MERCDRFFGGLRVAITTHWNGSVIQGRISRDGNRIDWDNGTCRVRDVLYSR